MPIVGDPESSVATGYCTVAEAQAAGATGATADIEAAILAATAGVDRFCNDRFLPTDMTVVATFGTNGVALLPRTVRSVSSVKYVGASSSLALSTYRVRKSSTPGDVDAVEIIGDGADILIAGAEPWSGGYANLGRPGRRIEVTGSFGWDAPPAAVRRACALLTAQLRTTPGGDEIAGVESLSVEGYSVKFGADAGSITTGHMEADRLLRPYRKPSVA